MEKRSIIFRGKRLDNGEWVEGFYGYKLESDKHFIMYEEINSNCPSYFMDIEVDPETVGQFTGLTDKNGKRIFEGDVLGGCNGSINGHGWEQKPILIKFSEGRFNVPLWAAKGEWDSTHYLVVIGNTHDNPELS